MDSRKLIPESGLQGAAERRQSESKRLTGIIWKRFPNLQGGRVPISNLMCPNPTQSRIHNENDAFVSPRNECCHLSKIESKERDVFLPRTPRALKRSVPASSFIHSVGRRSLCGVRVCFCEIFRVHRYYCFKHSLSWSVTISYLSAGVHYGILVASVVNSRVRSQKRTSIENISSRM